MAERLGVDYETAQQLNPSVIYCHTTMWGNDGPRATWPGFDQLAQSSCGLELELGGEGNPPNWYRFGMCDQACAMQSALAVLMALYWRERTGEGQLVDTSIVNGGVHLNTDAWIGPDGWSERPRTDQQQTGLGPLYRLYHTSDGWIALACLGRVALGARWRRRCPGSTTTPASPTPTRVAANADALADVLGDVPRRPDRAGRLRARSTARACRSRSPTRGRRPHVVRPQPDLVAAGLVADYEHPQYGRFRQFGHLVHLSDTPGRITADRRRCSASTRARCSPTSATQPTRSASCASSGVTVWPD